MLHFCSKEIIRVTQRLEFSNFVRLQEKAEDNINKRAAVEKEPLTLGKNKEDQSSYYLTYPKPAGLDMK